MRARELREKLFKSNPFCHWCGRRLRVKTCTLEHITPKADGGSNSLSNLALSCSRYNVERSNVGVKTCTALWPARTKRGRLEERSRAYPISLDQVFVRQSKHTLEDMGAL